MKTYYIGADVHSNSTELAIEHNGTIVSRHGVPTAIPAIKEILTSLGGKIHMTFYEARPVKRKICVIGSAFYPDFLDWPYQAPYSRVPLKLLQQYPF